MNRQIHCTMALKDAFSLPACSSSPCFHDGTCLLDKTGSYKCACLAGYTGQHCEHREYASCVGSGSARAGRGFQKRVVAACSSCHLGWSMQDSLCMDIPPEMWGWFWARMSGATQVYHLTFLAFTCCRYFLKRQMPWIISRAQSLDQCQWLNATIINSPEVQSLNSLSILMSEFQSLCSWASPWTPIYWYSPKLCSVGGEYVGISFSRL